MWIAGGWAHIFVCSGYPTKISIFPTFSWKVFWPYHLWSVQKQHKVLKFWIEYAMWKLLWSFPRGTLWLWGLISTILFLNHDSYPSVKAVKWVRKQWAWIQQDPWPPRPIDEMKNQSRPWNAWFGLTPFFLFGGNTFYRINKQVGLKFSWCWIVNQTKIGPKLNTC